jgi:hypothetical protein
MWPETTRPCALAGVTRLGSNQQRLVTQEIAFRFTVYKQAGSAGAANCPLPAALVGVPFVFNRGADETVCHSRWRRRPAPYRDPQVSRRGRKRGQAGGLAMSLDRSGRSRWATSPVPAAALPDPEHE